ncbi:SPOR domain-containing protein [Paracidovorax avenae]|uniref:SPOR domain-containing protein n=1 Tax=Paracidovorax avenae TaxID=80867 RepID=UPI00336AA616
MHAMLEATAAPACRTPRRPGRRQNRAFPCQAACRAARGPCQNPDHVRTLGLRGHSRHHRPTLHGKHHGRAVPRRPGPDWRGEVPARLRALRRGWPHIARMELGSRVAHAQLDGVPAAVERSARLRRRTRGPGAPGRRGRPLHRHLAASRARRPGPGGAAGGHRDPGALRQRHRPWRNPQADHQGARCLRHARPGPGAAGRQCADAAPAHLDRRGQRRAGPADGRLAAVPAGPVRHGTFLRRPRPACCRGGPTGFGVHRAGTCIRRAAPPARGRIGRRHRGSGLRPRRCGTHLCTIGSRADRGSIPALCFLGAGVGVGIGKFRGGSAAEHQPGGRIPAHAAPAGCQRGAPGRGQSRPGSFLGLPGRGTGIRCVQRFIPHSAWQRLCAVSGGIRTRIGPAGPGTSQRRLPPHGRPTASRPAAPATADRTDSAAVPARKLYINVGLFAEPANAQRAHGMLRGAGIPAATQPVTAADGRELLRVRAGPFTSASQANAAASRIRALGLETSAAAAQRP